MTRRLGTVRVWNEARQCAIIERPDSGEAVLCPLSAVEGDHKSLAPGQQVTFEQVMSERGWNLAKAVKVMC